MLTFYETIKGRLATVWDKAYSVPYILIEITPLCLDPWINIRDYSIFSDKVKVSRLRGEGT